MEDWALPVELTTLDHVRWASLRAKYFDYGGVVDKDVDLVHMTG